MCAVCTGKTRKTGRESEETGSIYRSAAYLAEIGQKGNIKLQALHNGDDLLAKYKSDVPQEQNVSPEDWMKKLQ